MSKDQLQIENGSIFSSGYGILAKKVMKDPSLTIEAKAIYSYLITYAGSGTEAYPPVKQIITDLNISKDRYYNHMEKLLTSGYIVKIETKEKGKFNNNRYVIKHFMEQEKPSPCPDDKETVNSPCPDSPDTDNQDTNSNSNNININNNIYSQLEEVYDFWIEQDIYKHKKLTAKFKTAIKSRLKDYSMDDIKRSIENYSKILKGEEYFFSYRWTIKDFMDRGIEKFMDWDTCYNNFLSKNNNVTYLHREIDNSDKVKKIVKKHINIELSTHDANYFWQQSEQDCELIDKIVRIVAGKVKNNYPWHIRQALAAARTQKYGYR